MKNVCFRSGSIQALGEGEKRNAKLQKRRPGGRTRQLTKTRSRSVSRRP